MTQIEDKPKTRPFVKTKPCNSFDVQRLQNLETALRQTAREIENELRWIDATGETSQLTAHGVAQTTADLAAVARLHAQEINGDVFDPTQCN